MYLHKVLSFPCGSVKLDELTKGIKITPLK